MSDEERSYDGVMSLLAGIGVGALIGAVAALLLAPQSGAETRHHLRERASDLGSNLRESLEELRSRVDELVVHVRRRGEGEARHGDVAQDTEATPGAA